MILLSFLSHNFTYFLNHFEWNLKLYCDQSSFKEVLLSKHMVEYYRYEIGDYTRCIVCDCHFMKNLPFIDWISVVGDLKIGKSVIRVTFIYNFTVFRYFFYYLRVYDFYHVFFILLRFIIRENENCCVPLEGWILIKMSLNQEIVHIDVLKTRAIEQISWKSLEKRKKYRRLLTLLLLVSMASSSSLHNNSLCFSSSTNACSIQVTHINDVKWISIAYWHAHRSKCSHK